MSDLTPIHTERAPRAVGPYSQAVVMDGWVFCSGQIPVAPGSEDVVAGGVAEQTEQVLTNLSNVLRAAGSSLESVVKTTVFLADMGEFGAMNAVYARHFGNHRPARATVEVGGLPKGCRIEIECIGRVEG